MQHPTINTTELWPSTAEAAAADRDKKKYFDHGCGSRGRICTLESLKQFGISENREFRRYAVCTSQEKKTKQTEELGALVTSAVHTQRRPGLCRKTRLSAARRLGAIGRLSKTKLGPQKQGSMPRRRRRSPINQPTPTSTTVKTPASQAGDPPTSVGVQCSKYPRRRPEGRSE